MISFEFEFKFEFVQDLEINGMKETIKEMDAELERCGFEFEVEPHKFESQIQQDEPGI